MSILDLLPATRQSARDAHESVKKIHEEIVRLQEHVEMLERRIGATDSQSVFQRIEQADQGINNHLAYKVNILRDDISSYGSKSEVLLWELFRNEGESSEDARGRFFRNLPPATGPLRLLQLGCAQLLKEFDALCAEQGLNYWAAFGTLLGAVRHRGFIPWDDDMDLGMLRADALKLIETIQQDPRYTITVVYDPYVFCRQVRFKYANADVPCFLDIFLFDNATNVERSTFMHQQQLRSQLIEGLKAEPWYDSWLEEGCVSETTELGQEIAARFDTYLERARGEGILAPEGSAIIWGLDNMDDTSFEWICPKEDIFPTVQLPFEDCACRAPASWQMLLAGSYGDIYALPNDIVSHFDHVDPASIKNQEFYDAIRELLDARKASPNR